MLELATIRYPIWFVYVTFPKISILKFFDYSIMSKMKIQKNSHFYLLLYLYSMISFCPIWYLIYLWINWLHSYYWSTSVSEKPTKFLPYVFSSYFILIQVYLRNLLVVGNSRISLLLALYLFLLLNTIHNGAVKNVFNTYNCHHTLDIIKNLNFNCYIQTYLPSQALTHLV